MSALLLVTKYHLPPAAEKRVERTRLLLRLDELLAPGKRMALVSAPAGSGKTTLVGSWIKNEESQDAFFHPSSFTPALAPERSAGASVLHPGSFAWLSLDEEDNDPATFLSYLSAALQAACPDLTPDPNEPFAADPNSPPPVRTRLAGLVNGLAEVPGMTVLVLDDYHVISSAAVHESMAFLLDHLPERARLVISTRADALLPVSRLRARGQLVELREADLRFTPEEAAEYLNDCMGLRLGAAEVGALTGRTEGWAAGLQLAALALRGLPEEPQAPAEFIRGFSGSHRFVLDYLLDEVFSRLPEELRAFLLQTSILNRLCAPLCDAMLVIRDWGLENSNDHSLFTNLYSLSSASILASLEGSNLFLIPLDDRRAWYRYHHLFAGLLRSRAGQALTSAELAGLHRRASAWFSGQGLVEEAIHHALQAGDFDPAADLVEGCAQAVISGGRQTTLQRWLAALPAAVLLQRPKLRIFQAWTRYIQGDASAAIQILEDTQPSLDGLPETERLQALRGEFISVLAMSSLTSGDSQRVIRLAQDALERTPPTSLTPRARLMFSQAMAYAMVGDRRYLPAITGAFELARQAGNHYLAAGILYNRAFGTIVFSLHLQSAWQACQQIVDLYPTPAAEPAPAPLGLGLIGQAAIALERSDLDAAARLLERGMDLCRQGGISLADFSALLVRARLAQARGDFAGAAAALADAAGRSALVGWKMNATLLAQAQVRLSLAAGDVDAAERAARGGDLPAGSDFPVNLQEIWKTSRASVLLARGRPEDALALLEGLVPQAQAGERAARVIEGSLLQALALHALHREALEPLRRALALSRPQGVTRLYLEAGPAARDLLTAYRVRLGDLTAEAGRLLGEIAPAAPSPAPSLAQLVEPLTPRELDVLRLIAEGLSNQEIANRLFLSLSAIKKYTGSLYGKLGVDRRAQAIARARELHLI
jgi:LuxR family maltose regulon positive regulatory protein